MTPDPSRQRNLFGGFDVWQQILPYLGLLYFILGWFTASVEGLLRYDMGERYFSRLNFLAGLLVITFFAGTFNIIVGGVSGFFGGNGFSGLIFLVLLVYICMGIVHILGHRRRNKRDEPMHSLFPGKSWFSPLFKVIPFLTEELFFRVVEPVIVMVLAFVFFKIDAIIATWLFVSAIALAVHTSMRLENERNVFLDLRDQSIEANWMRAAMQGSPEAEAHGVRLAESTRMIAASTAKEVARQPRFFQEMQVSNPTVSDALAALSPELQAMMNLTPPKDEPSLPAQPKAEG